MVSFPERRLRWPVKPRAPRFPAAVRSERGVSRPEPRARHYRWIIALQGFKTVQRRGIAVSGGDRAESRDADPRGRGPQRNHYGHRREPARADDEWRAVVHRSDRAGRKPADFGQPQLHDAVLPRARDHGGTWRQRERRDSAAAHRRRRPANIMMDGVSTMDLASNVRRCR